jgi:hypothetical protein
MIITKNNLIQALTQWEQLNREGGCIPEPMALEMPLEQRVQESAEYLWTLLQQESGTP